MKLFQSQVLLMNQFCRKKAFGNFKSVIQLPFDLFVYLFEWWKLCVMNGETRCYEWGANQSLGSNKHKGHAVIAMLLH